MAAAVIPVIASVISAVGPQIPAIVQFVEALFGHSKDTGKQTGDVKLQTAVQLLQQALTALANSGVIPSQGVVDPSLPAALAGAVQQVVDALKTQGQLTGTETASVTPSGLVIPVIVAGIQGQLVIGAIK
jgi:hypothetical protein